MMGEVVSTESLIAKFTDMANRGALLTGTGITQGDLLAQIIGTIHVVLKEENGDYMADGSMSYDDAIKYCEEHDCSECDGNINKLGIRTIYEKQVRDVPYCINLISKNNDTSEDMDKKED